MKFPVHRARFREHTVQAGYEQRKFHSDCSLSRLLVCRDPAYPALAGRGTCRSNRTDKGSIDRRTLSMIIKSNPSTLRSKGAGSAWT